MIAAATTKEDGVTTDERIIGSGHGTLSESAAAEAKAVQAPVAKNDTKPLESRPAAADHAKKAAGGSAGNGMTDWKQESRRDVYDRRRLLAEDRLPLRRRHSHQARPPKTTGGGAGDTTYGIGTGTMGESEGGQGLETRAVTEGVGEQWASRINGLGGGAEA